MKCYYFKDVKKSIFLKKKEFLKVVCLYLLFLFEVFNMECYKIYMNFFFLKKLNMNFEVKNYCILMKNSSVVMSFLGMISLNLKYLINWGMLNGISKWSW